MTFAFNKKAALTRSLYLATSILVANPVPSFAQDKAFDIPQQSLSQALIAFAKQSDTVVTAQAPLVDGKFAPEVRGQMSADAALKKLLEGSGLKATAGDSGTFVIQSSAREHSAVAPRGETPTKMAQAGSVGSSSSVAMVAAQKNGAASQVPDQTSSIQTTQSTGQQPEEIVVTAQKRSERLLDVPVPVSVLNTNSLADNSLTRVQDYFVTVPGVNLIVSGNGNQTIIIRGLSTASGNATVSTLIDDVPFGAANISNLGGSLYPDIDPSDLDRIEILRGPQGTLYGADSLGGLIKFVTKDPSTTEFSGRIETVGEAVDHGGLGYGLHAAVNIPVSDTFAIRASGFTRLDPGYMDNVQTGQRNVNWANVYGGRIAALWQPTDNVSLKVVGLLQNVDANGNSWINTDSLLRPVIGTYQQTLLRGTPQLSDESSQYTATLNVRLGAFDITSITGRGESKFTNSQDLSTLSFLLASTAPGAAVTEPDSYDTTKWTQEFRVSSSFGGWVDWLVGAFYTYESTPSYQELDAVDPITGRVLSLQTHWQYSPDYLEEWAAFADVTFHINDWFSVQVGGRQSQNWQTWQQSLAYGPLIPALDGLPASGFTLPAVHATGSPFTYLVTPEIKLSPDVMIYARIASGYRIGGFNLSYPKSPVPTSYTPDTTTNYEVGVKGDIFNHTLIVDASAYYIDWKKIQLGLYNSVTYSAYTGNGSTARSDGVELSLQTHPLGGLTLSATGSLDDAVLTQNLPALSQGIGLKGDRLPYSARFAGSFSAEQTVYLNSDWTGFAGATLSYIGTRQGPFSANTLGTSVPLPRLTFPAYATINLHVGAYYESWKANFFVNNAGNERGLIGGGPDYNSFNTGGYYATLIQPRTFGLSVSKTF